MEKSFEELQKECIEFNKEYFNEPTDTRFAFVSPTSDKHSIANFMLQWKEQGGNIEELKNGTFYRKFMNLFPHWDKHLGVFVTDKTELDNFYRKRTQKRFSPPTREKWEKGEY